MAYKRPLTETQRRIEREWHSRRRARIKANGSERIDRQYVIDRDGGICHICGKLAEVIHLDHVIPLARGGSHTHDNLKVACSTCNLTKQHSLCP